MSPGEPYHPVLAVSAATPKKLTEQPSTISCELRLVGLQRVDVRLLLALPIEQRHELSIGRPHVGADRGGSLLEAVRGTLGQSGLVAPIAQASVYVRLAEAGHEEGLQLDGRSADRFQDRLDAGLEPLVFGLARHIGHHAVFHVLRAEAGSIAAPGTKEQHQGEGKVGLLAHRMVLNVLDHLFEWS